MNALQILDADIIFLIAAGASSSIIIAGAIIARRGKKIPVVEQKPIMKEEEHTRELEREIEIAVESMRGKGVKLDFQPASTKPLARYLKIGDLECRSILGSGGFATTFLAVDKGGRNYVVKVPNEMAQAMHMGESFPTIREKDLERFLREVEIMKKLDHPNILKIIGYGRVPPYLVMEYCESGPLRGVLGEGKAVNLKAMLEVSIQIADALFHLHGGKGHEGIRHGDIKPENILFTKDGVPKLSDFNISRIMNTVSRSSRGYSPGYSAPEQIFSDLGEPDDKSDTWSFGAVMYEMLTGERPFGIEDYDRRIKEGKPESIRNCPKELDDIIMKTLSFEKKMRYGSADKIRDDLAKVYVEHLPSV